MSFSNYKIWAWISVIFLLGLMTLYVKEFNHFGNTIGIKRLIWLSIGVGLAAGIYFGWRLQKQGEEQVDKIRIWAASILLPVMFAPLITSLTNRLLSPHPVQHETFEFFQEKPYATELYGIMEGEQIKPDGYYLFVYKDGNLYRFNNEKRYFEGVERGEKITLPIKKGLWGFKYLKENELIPRGTKSL